MLDPVLRALYSSISEISRVVLPCPVVIAFWLSVIAFFSFFLFNFGGLYPSGILPDPGV